MRPPPDRVLQQLMLTLIGDVAPTVSVEYLQKNMGIISMLLAFVAEEWDRAAQRRVEENRELRRLLAEAASEVTDGKLAGRLRAASHESKSSVTLSVLDAANDALRALLIELHAHVEGRRDPQGKRIEGEIWRELVRSTERRALSMAPF